MKNSSRAGFSFFDVLVVVTLLLILFSLFLPAALRARMLAGRSSSSNNLKQIGLACHTYHDVNGHFPSGNDAKNFSASAYLLPYVEQDNVFKLIDFNQESTSEANKVIRATQIRVFMSPLDPVKAVTADSAPTNYLYNAGSLPGLVKNDGTFFQESKIKFNEITDGTSNTIMVGETLKGDGSDKAVTVRRQHVKLNKDALKDLKDESGEQDFKDNKNIAADRCARWIDGRFMQGTFTGTRPPNDPRPDVNCEGVGGLSALRSLEDGFVQIGICDGSVRVLGKKIDPVVWKAMTTRAGGEVVNFD